MFAADRASNALGIALVHCEPGHATATMTITETMLNGHAMTHGGYVFLLADTAFGAACNGYGAATVAASADIVFLAPTGLGDELVAQAHERVRYGRSGVYDVTVRVGGTVVAEFRGGSRSLRAPASREATGG